MKGKKNQNVKGHTRTKSEIIMPSSQNEFKEETPKFQILGNAGGDYIKTKLPEDFYQNITFGEMSLEYDFSIQKLTDLMDLYSLGIQYFLENDPPQAKVFQDRMGFILTNKDTLLKLKKQQNEEQREKEEKEREKEKEKRKSKIGKKLHDNNKKVIYPKSAKTLPKANLRKRARTNFLMKSQGIKDEEIKRKVSFVLNNDPNKIKEDKENVKNIISDDINKQDLQWKEKLKMKRNNNLNTSFGSDIKQRNKTFMLKTKRFQTPGLDFNRGIMILKSPSKQKSPSQGFLFNNHFKTDINKKDLNKNNDFNDIDLESSDQDEKNEEDIDFLKQFDETHKKNNDEESGNDSDNRSENSNDYLKKIDEVDEEYRKTLILEEINKKKSIEKKVSEFNIYDEVKNNQNEKENNNENKEKENNNEDKEKENNNENKEKENNNENKEKEDKTETQNTEIKKDLPPCQQRQSIVDRINALRKIDPDKKIVQIIEEKMKILENLDDINLKTNNNKEDEEATEVQTDEISALSNNYNPIQDLKLTIDEIPLKFQDTYYDVEDKMKDYVSDLNNHFYKDTFEVFSLKLKDLYDQKYNNYIEVNTYYHSNIKEKEYQLENDNKLNDEKKRELQQIIESLKEEQKDQIDKITDEYNQLIDTTISDFKQNFFKKDVGIYLMEEQLKLDIYTLINEAFY